MGRPLRIIFPGAHYHITARGNEKKDIFKSRWDRERFLSYLESSNSRYGARIHAYCLMNNHYHLLLETPEGNLPEIIRHINGAYTNYFNKKHQRVGHLLQGRYKAILIEADEYLMELTRYIHLNPVRAGKVGKPDEHPWSSYRDYIGERSIPSWLSTSQVLGKFSAPSSYKRFVEHMLDKEYQSPLQATVSSTLLGSEPFIREVMAIHIDGRRVERDIPAIRALSKSRIIETIMHQVQGAIEDPRLSQKVAIYLAHRYSGAKLKELEKHFGKKESAISQTSRRLVMAMSRDAALQKVVARLEEDLKKSWV